MRVNYIKSLLYILLTLSPVLSMAQTNQEAIQFEGVIKDKNGDPLANADVTDDNGVRSTTDDNGKFRINTFLGGNLRISAKNYVSKLVPVDTSSTEFNLVAQTDDELVNVAFRRVNRRDLFGDVAAVDVKQLIEKNYYHNSLDNLGTMVGGFTGNIWNMGEYMVLIDGIQRDAFSDIRALEIDQITVLKGVNAVALYGSRAAKGVIQITTKRGTANEKSIKVRANTGLEVPKSYPSYLGSAEYMTLFNEARQNDGLDRVFSDEAIYNHGSGQNPYRYPNVNYYSPEYLRKYANRSDVFTEISGGNDRAQFYTNIGYIHSNSLLHYGESANDYSNRLNLRGNIDLKINDFIKTAVNATAIYNNGRSAHGDFWNRASSIRPHRFAPLIPISYLDENDTNSQILVENSNYLIDGKYMLGGTNQEMANTFADMIAAGYNHHTLRQFQFTNSINFDLQRILDGLSFNTLFGIDYSSSYNQSLNNQYAVYEPIWNSYAGVDKISYFNKIGEDRRSGVQNISNTWQQQTISFSGFFDYKKTIDEKHNLTGILVATGHQRRESNFYHAVHSHVNLGLQLGYNYLNKYYADFSGNVLHSAKLAPGQRMGFSPTVSLGWRLSDEPFLQSSDIVDDLKITASAGIVNTDVDINGYYLYQELHAHANGTWYGWRDNSLALTTDVRRSANPNLSFIQRKEINLGLEATLFKNRLSTQVNVFTHRFDGFITQPNSIFPNYFTTNWPNSSFVPFINYNNDSRSGIDFNIVYHQSAASVDWSLGITGAAYKNKATRREENFEESYQNRAGRPIDAIFGLVSNGFFNDLDDIANHPDQAFGEVRPGDIKYVDQNGDGVIDFRDEVMIGRFGAPFSLGLHYTLQWKNFTFFAMANGHFGGQALKNNPYFWVSGDQKYSEVVRDRWTEGTKNTASYPRLTSIANDNNFRTSDFWIYNTDRFNLSRVQISYDFKSELFRKSVIRGLGIYVLGSDLLTIAKEREILEMNIGTAPQMRFYNLGVKANF